MCLLDLNESFCHGCVPSLGSGSVYRRSQSYMTVTRGACVVSEGRGKDWCD